jgi:hypothetical protein
LGEEEKEAAWSLAKVWGYFAAVELQLRIKQIRWMMKMRTVTLELLILLLLMLLLLLLLLKKEDSQAEALPLCYRADAHPRHLSAHLARQQRRRFRNRKPKPAAIGRIKSRYYTAPIQTLHHAC